MNDRELLEAAYKAYRPGENYVRLVNDAGRDYWNPLTDDGDALRLAVKLRLNVDAAGFSYPNGETKVFDANKRLLSREEHQDGAGNGAHAATRRAIVRAAAAMGEKR